MVSLKGHHHRKTKHFHDLIFKLNEVWFKAVYNPNFRYNSEYFEKKGKNVVILEIYQNIFGVISSLDMMTIQNCFFLDEQKWSQDGHHNLWSFLFVSMKKNYFNKPQNGFSLNFFRKKNYNKSME